MEPKAQRKSRKTDPNSLKNDPNVLKTARNYASFRQNEVLFPRKCITGNWLQLRHGHDLNNPFAIQHLQPITSFDNRQSIHNDMSYQEIRPTSRAGKNVCGYTNYNQRLESSRTTVHGPVTP
jgi:hypothetical protein